MSAKINEIEWNNVTNNAELSDSSTRELVSLFRAQLNCFTSVRTANTDAKFKGVMTSAFSLLFRSLTDDGRVRTKCFHCGVGSSFQFIYSTSIVPCHHYCRNGTHPPLTADITTERPRRGISSHQLLTGKVPGCWLHSQTYTFLVVY